MPAPGPPITASPRERSTGCCAAKAEPKKRHFGTFSAASLRARFRARNLTIHQNLADRRNSPRSSRWNSMYHSPVPMESDAPESDLRPEVAESVALDLGSERLRDAHLHNGQVEARALFAPFFAVTAVAAALITAWAMYGSVELEARRRLDRPGRLRQLGLVPPRARGRGLGQQPHRPAARALVRGRRGGRASPACGRRCRPTPSPPSRRTSRS